MNDKDDFWNLDRILPKKTVVKQNLPKVATYDVKTKNSSSHTGVDIRTLFSAVNERKGINTLESAIEKECDYTHFSDSRIMRYAYVGFYNSSLSYDSKARTYALNFFDKRVVGEVDFVDYFSFKPSFSELSASQLEYYVYWRDQIRGGNFIKTSPSYVMLLVSEIINLPDKIDPEVAVCMLIDLWEKAFDDKSRVDKIFFDTVFEYCLVHNVPMPYKKLSAVFNSAKSPVSHILGSLYVIDYLLANTEDLSERDLEFIFENCLSYSYKQGKHYTNNQRFKNLLDTSFYKVLLNFFKNSPDFISKIFDNHEKRASPIKIIKPAFLNVNASFEIKRNIVFEYYSFDKSDVEFQQLINIAKNVENRFRSECGIRARLAVSVLPPEFRAPLDKSALDVLYQHDPIGVRAESNMHKKVNINVKRAMNIEESSWDTTKMLTDGIDVFFEDTTEIVEETSDSMTLSELELSVLYALTSSDVNKAELICREAGQFLDSVIASVNEKVFDVFDDIVIDTSSKSVYDDYILDITEMFFKEKK